MKAKKILSMILLIAYVFVLYWAMGTFTDYPPLPILIAAALAIPFMVVTHELGHLIFGLLTGYRFVSFRVFSLMLAKDNGKWAVRRMSIPGTAGQCLMAPPRKKDGKYPFVLYNLGGILFCGVLSLVPTLLGLYLPSRVGLPLFIFGFVSLVMNLMNAIPTNGKSMINDATNIRMAKKSEAARAALWNQLEYVALHSQNIRTGDMSEELFFLPDSKELSNPLITWQITADIERAEDLGEYEKARDTAYFALDNAAYLFPLYESLLRLEAIYLDAILGKDSAGADEYFEKVKKQPALQTLISFHRASYAYFLLQKQNPKEAEKALALYEKKIKSAPFEAEVSFEQRQLEQIRQKANP